MEFLKLVVIILTSLTLILDFQNFINLTLSFFNNLPLFLRFSLHLKNWEYCGYHLQNFNCLFICHQLRVMLWNLKHLNLPFLKYCLFSYSCSLKYSLIHQNQHFHSFLKIFIYLGDLVRRFLLHFRFTLINRKSFPYLLEFLVLQNHHRIYCKYFFMEFHFLFIIL